MAKPNNAIELGSGTLVAGACEPVVKVIPANFMPSLPSQFVLPPNTAAFNAPINQKFELVFSKFEALPLPVWPKLV